MIPISHRIAIAKIRSKEPRLARDYKTALETEDKIYWG
jgi:hypothetical protein